MLCLGFSLLAVGFAEIVVRMTLGNLNVVMPWPEQHKLCCRSAGPAWLPPVAFALVVSVVSV